MRFVVLFILTFWILSVFVYSDTVDFNVNHGKNKISDDFIDFSNRGLHHYQDYIDIFGDEDDNFKVYINSVNGNLYHSRTDYLYDVAAIPLRITFTYNSGSSFIGNYGNKWQFNYNIRFAENNYNKHKIIVYPDDRTSLYLFNKIKNSYEAELFSFDSLFYDSENNLIFKFDGSYFTDKRNRLFANFGKDSNFSVKTLSDDYGNKLNFNYSDDCKLNTLVFQNDKSVKFEYDSNLLNRIILPDNKELKYIFSDDNSLTSVQLTTGKYIHYQFDECGQLIKITTDDKEITIAYDSDYRVSAIINHYNDIVYSLLYDTLNRKTTLILPDKSEKYYLYDNKERSIEYRYGNYSFKKNWNNRNQISSITDGNGYVTHYNYNDFGQPANINYPDNLSEIYQCNSDDNSLNFTNRAGATSIYYFNDDGSINRYINSLGEEISFLKNKQGELSDIVFSDELKVSLYRDQFTRIKQFRINGIEQLILDYNTNDELASIKDVFGSTTTFNYDQNCRLTSINYPNKSIYSLLFNDKDRIVTVKERNLAVINYKFDALGRLIELTNNGLHPFKFDYKSFRDFSLNYNGLDYAFNFGINRKLEKVLKPDNLAYVYKYDNNNNITILNYNSLSHSFKYDELSQVVEYTNPNGFSNKYSYSPLGNINSYSNIDGKTTLIYYDIHGRIARKAVGGLNVYYDYSNSPEIKINFNDIYTIRRNYNGLGQLVEVKTEGSDNYFYAYDLSGNISEITKNNMNTTKLYYNESYNLRNIIYPNNYNLVLNYSLGKQIIEKSDNLGFKSKYEYDLFGRITKITDESGLVRNYSWNAYNDLVKFTDKSKNIFNFGYTSDEIILTYPNNSLVTFKYTLLLNNKLLISVENDDNISIRFNYDKIGNFIRSTDDYAEQILVEYNNDNTPSFVRNPNNETHHFTYDFLGRVLSIRNPENKNSSYQYDALSNLTQITDYSGLSYHLSHRVDGRLFSVNSQDFKIQYIYDSENRLSSFNHYDSEFLKFRYNGENVSEIISKNNDTIKLNYDVRNRLISKINESGIIYTYQYEPNGYLKNIMSSTGNRLNFQRDNSGNILNLDIDGKKLGQFSYNSIGLLTSVNAPDTMFSISYNSVGDIVQISGTGANVFEVTNDILGRKNSIRYPENRKENFVYDSKGNVITYTSTNAQVFEYEYNYRNQLTKSKWSKIDSIQVDYSPDGQIIAITDPNNSKSEFNWTSGNKINRINLFGSGTTNIFIKDGKDQNRQISILIGSADTLNFILDNALRFKGIDRNGFAKIDYNNSGIKLNNYFILNYLSNENYWKFGIVNNRYSYLKADDDSLAISYSGNSLTPTNLANKYIDYTIEFDDNYRLHKFNDFIINYTGNLVQLINNNNANSIYFTYDFSNQLTSINNNLDYLTLFNYDDNSNLISINDNLNNGLDLIYDNKGNVRYIKNYDKKNLEYLYDNNSNLIISKNESFDEIGIKYFNNLPVEIDYPDLSNLTLTYNKWLNTTKLISNKIFASEMTLSNYPYGLNKVFSINYSNQFNKTFSNLSDNIIKINDLVIRDINKISDTLTEIKIIGNQLIKFQNKSGLKSLIFPNGYKYTFERTQFYINKSLFDDKFNIQNSTGSIISNYNLTYSKPLDKIDLKSIHSNLNYLIRYNYDSRGRLIEYIENNDLPISISYYPDWRIKDIVENDVTLIRDYDDNNRLIRNGDINLNYDDRGNVISKSIGSDTINFIYNFENLLTEIIDFSGDTTRLIYSPRSTLIGIIKYSDTLFLLPSDETAEPKYPYIRAYMDSKGNIEKIFDYFEIDGMKISFSHNIADSKTDYQIYTRDQKLLYNLDNSGNQLLVANLISPFGVFDSTLKGLSILSFNDMLYIDKVGLYFDGKRFYDPEIMDYLQVDEYQRFNPYNSNPLEKEVNIKTEQFAIPIDAVLPIYNPFNNRFTNINDEVNPYKIIEKELNDHFNNFKNFCLTVKSNYKNPTIQTESIIAINPENLFENYQLNSNGLLIFPELPDELLDTMLLNSQDRIIPRYFKKIPKGNEFEILKGYVELTDIPQNSLLVSVITKILDIKNPAKISYNNIIDESVVKPDLEMIEKFLNERNFSKQIIKQNLLNYTKDYDLPMNKISGFLPKIDFDNEFDYMNVLEPHRFISQLDVEIYSPKQLIPKYAEFSERILRENLINFLDDAMSTKVENLFPGRTLYRHKYLPLPYNMDYENNLPEVLVRKKRQFFDLNKNN